MQILLYAKENKVIYTLILYIYISHTFFSLIQRNEKESNQNLLNKNKK